MSCLAFPSCHRILARQDFSLCYEHGRKIHTANFIVFIRRREQADQPWRLGVAVTKKNATAIRRNRIRRLLKECFRIHQEVLRPGFDFVVVSKRSLASQVLHLAMVEKELLPLLSSHVKRVGTV